MQYRNVAVKITLAVIRLSTVRRKKWMRVVVPPTTLHKNVITVLTRAGDTADESVPEAYSSISFRKKWNFGCCSGERERFNPRELSHIYALEEKKKSEVALVRESKCILSLSTESRRGNVESLRV